MKKSLRIGYNRYYDDAIFAEHLKYIEKNADVIDEITLFDAFSHYGYWDLDFCRKNAEILKDRIARYKKIGIKRVGVNILDTIGHVEEGWDVLPKASLQYITNEKGETSRACLCPSNEEFLNYTKEKYAIYADTGADFVWYDDDLRIRFHGVAKNGCFCQKCIDKFNSEYDFELTREELVEKIKADKKIKGKWGEFQKNVMLRLMKVIETGTHKNNPQVKVGAMTTMSDKHSTNAYIKASKAELCRPGGGFYNDDYPTELFDKIYLTQKQTSDYPREIKDIQYEYEAFNYQELDKSMQISEIEVNLSILAGCNGILFNNDIFDDRDDIIELFRKCASFWDKLCELNEECVPIGVFCDDFILSRQLNQIGIATTARKNAAVASVILGNSLGGGEDRENYSDAEIEKFIKNGLLTDGKGLEILCGRGFEELCGGKIAKVHKSGMAERFSENELNGSFKNYYRDVFMNFFSEEATAYELEPKENAVCLSNAETITHKKGGCSMYVKDKFAADGYFMNNFLKYKAKREQLTNVLEKISDNSLPVRIKKCLRVSPMVASNENGDMNIMLTNASFDATGEFECEIKTDKEIFRLSENGTLLPVKQRKTEKSVIVSIENINRWDYIVLTTKNML